MMMDRIFEKDEEGVSNVVTTILLFSLFMIMFSTIMSIYIPNWSKGREYEHSLKVEEDIITLKNTMDMQMLRDDTDVTMSTPLEVGYPGLPFNGMGTVNGVVYISPSASRFNISILNTSDSQQLGYSYGSLYYTSIYSNFPPQTYSYEDGAVILSQDNKNIKLSGPHFNARTANTYLLSDTGSSEPAQPDGGYGLYEVGNTNNTDDSQVSFTFDGNTGRGILTLEAKNIDNASSVSVWVSDGITERLVGWLQPTPGSGAWANQTLTIPNSFMADEGWNVNTLTFKTPWTDDWQIRNITLIGRTVIVSTTLVSFIGEETSVGGTDVKIIETTLVGKQVLNYGGTSRNITVRINTTHYDTWMQMLNDTMTTQNFGWGTDYSIDLISGGGSNNWGVVELNIYYVDVLNIQNAIFRIKLI